MTESGSTVSVFLEEQSTREKSNVALVARHDLGDIRESDLHRDALTLACRGSRSCEHCVVDMTDRGRRVRYGIKICEGGAP